MIKAIFFDFDHCLFDTHSMGTGYLESILSILEKSTVPEPVKKEFRSRLHLTDFDEALRALPIPEDIAKVMRSAYAETTPPHGNVYDDLVVLEELPVLKVLVTSGFQRFQEQKIAHSGVAEYMDEVVIDPFDVHPRKGKQKIFEELLAQHALLPEEVLVVGDKPTSELAAGNALGIPTVQILRPGTVRWEGALHHIASLSELKELLA